MPQEITRDFRCTDAELFAVVTLLIKNYQNKLSVFTAHKPKYIAAFGDAITTDSATAEAMAGIEQNDAVAEILRTQLIPLSKKCTDNWNILESYIVGVYAPAEQKPAKQAAGSTNYDKAFRRNWEYTKSLNVAANGFITTNLTKLLDGGNNMTGTFQADYASDATAFLDTYNLYVTATETTVDTKAKIIAMNAVYARCMSLIADGKVIGQNDAAFLKLFTWIELLHIVSPPGAASLGVLIEDSETVLPIAGVNVKITKDGDAPISFDTDVNGLIDFNSIPSGTYTVKVFKQGYVTQNITKVVNVGVNARLVVLFVAGITP